MPPVYCTNNQGRSKSVCLPLSILLFFGGSSVNKEIVTVRKNIELCHGSSSTVSYRSTSATTVGSHVRTESKGNPFKGSDICESSK